MKLSVKRLKINKVLRIVLVLVTALLICTTSFFLYREIKIPTVIEEKVKLFNYTTNSSADYKVYLKPNSLYSSSSLGKGQYYITNYVDNIQATFNFEYKGERNSDIIGYYEVAAEAEGYIVREKEHITIWKRKFALIPQKGFAVRDERLSIVENVDIKLGEYNDFAAAIVEESKVQTAIQLNIYMEVNLKADTDKGPLEAKQSPTISIPLDNSYFIIAESGAKEELGSIEEVQKVKLPPNKQRILLYEIGLGSLILIIMVLIIFTEAYMKSLFRIKLDKIFKLHGSRLVALNSELLAAALDNCSIVKSIDDLVRVADEIGRPIMYEYCEEYNEMVHFYVLDDKRTYLYILRDSSFETNVTITDEKKVAL